MQATNITLTDREGTPVSHVFVPMDKDTGYYSFVEANSVPIGQNKLAVAWKEVNGKRKLRLIVTVPVVVTEVVNGVSRPKLERTAYADLNLTFDNTSTLQERKNIVGMMEKALASTQTLLDATLTQLQGIS